MGNSALAITCSTRVFYTGYMLVRVHSLVDVLRTKARVHMSVFNLGSGVTLTEVKKSASGTMYCRGMSKEYF